MTILQGKTSGQKSNADSKVIWMDGELVPYERATVPVLSHSLHYGCAAFEGIRAYETTDGRTAVFRLREHMQRFLQSAHALTYQSPFSHAELCEAVLQTIRANGFKECYIRPIAYLDDSVRGLKLPASPQCRVAIATWNWGKYLGAEVLEKGVRVRVSSYRRQEPASALAHAKLAGAYLTAVLARREAALSGCDEAILLDPQGFVAEGSGENLFVIKDGTIATPPEGYILPGITRDCAMKLAKKLGFELQERNITRNQLYLADELFFTGTAAEITPVCEVDGHAIGTGKPGPVTQKISHAFFSALRGEAPEWLSYV